jgi:hypothetical protein
MWQGLRRRRGARPILVNINTFITKLYALRNTRNLAGTSIRVEDDLFLESREIRRGLIPYLKDAKRRGHRVYLKKDRFIVDVKTSII